MSKKRKSGKADRDNFIRGSAMTAVLVALVVAIIGSVWWFFAYTKDDGLIYPNVFVFDTDLGGKTPEEAVTALHALTDDTYSVQDMTVRLPDATLTLTPQQTGAALNVDALVQLAYSYGRGGNRWENTQAKAEAALTRFEPDVGSCLTLDTDAIRAVLDQAAAAAASTLTQPQITVTGETPDLNLSYKKAMEQTDVAHKTLTVTLGTPDRSLDVEALLQTIVSAYRANDFTPIEFAYDVTQPEAPDLDAIHAQNLIAPVDAVLDETDYSITHETLGYGFDLEALKALVAAAGEGETVSISFGYLPAALTFEAIDATLFKDVLGSVSTNHTGDSNRNTNLKLACKAINGKLIRPGETFSYNAPWASAPRRRATSLPVPTWPARPWRPSAAASVRSPPPSTMPASRQTWRSWSAPPTAIPSAICPTAWTQPSAGVPWTISSRTTPTTPSASRHRSPAVRSM